MWSIGAVARILDLSAATLRTWEARYGLVVPERSDGGQRLYTRAQVEQLRFLRDQVAAGRRPGEAHRLLAERIAAGVSEGRMCVLLVGSQPLEPLRTLLGTDSFEVEIAADALSAARKLAELSPALVVIDTNDASLGELVGTLRAEGKKVLPVELLQGTLALLDEARTHA